MTFPRFTLSLLAGAVALSAGCVSASRCRHELDRSAVMSSAASGDAALSALSRFRRGDTNAAVQSLEQHLDAQITILESFLRDIPKSEHEPVVVRFMERARAYRVAHPSPTRATEGTR